MILKNSKKTKVKAMIQNAILIFILSFLFVLPTYNYRGVQRSKNQAVTKSSAMAYYTQGSPIAEEYNVGYIVNCNLTGSYGNEYGKEGFKVDFIVENQNSKPVLVRHASFRLPYTYTYNSSNGSSNRSSSVVATFPQEILLAPGTYITKSKSKKTFGTKRKSDLKVYKRGSWEDKMRGASANINVRVIDEMQKTTDKEYVGTSKQVLSNVKGVNISIYMEKKNIGRLEGNKPFIKYTPVLRVENTTNSKIKLKDPIALKMHYGFYSESYEIRIGKVKAYKVKERKGFIDRSPAMNYEVPVYVSNVKIPDIKY